VRIDCYLFQWERWGEVLVDIGRSALVFWVESLKFMVRLTQMVLAPEEV